MIEEGRAGPPHDVILAVVVVLVMVLPTLLGDQGEAITDFIAELLSPDGLLLLPIDLLLTIQFLSSDNGSFVASIFSTGEPNTIHRVSGSPVGVALFLVLVLFLLYNRVSIFILILTHALPPTETPPSPPTSSSPRATTP